MTHLAPQARNPRASRELKEPGKTWQDFSLTHCSGDRHSCLGAPTPFLALCTGSGGWASLSPDTHLVTSLGVAPVQSYSEERIALWKFLGTQGRTLWSTLCLGTSACPPHTPRAGPVVLSKGFRVQGHHCLHWFPLRKGPCLPRHRSR